MKQVELNDMGGIVVDAFGHLLDALSGLRLHDSLCCWLLVTYITGASSSGNCPQLKETALLKSLFPGSWGQPYTMIDCCGATFLNVGHSNSIVGSS